MKTRFYTFLLLTIGLFSCKTGIKETTPDNSHGKMEYKTTYSQSTNFTGIIKELQTNELIPFATIKLSDEKGVKRAAATDLNGYFSIKDLPLGNYRMFISAAGYESIENIFRVESHANYELNIKLSKSEIRLEKPVIYLYPTEKQKVHVKLKYAGTLTHTYPKYPENGWLVIAEPNGTLWDTNKLEYYALFWEGKPKKQIIPQDGFVVAGNETAAFLEEKLAYLGLTRREANEFIMYWLPRMEDNAFNFIHFSGKDYEDQAELEIHPKPETTIRIMMITQALDYKIKVPLQDLNTLKKTRNGFTVVEWGGSVINHFKEDS